MISGIDIKWRVKVVTQQVKTSAKYRARGEQPTQQADTRGAGLKDAAPALTARPSRDRESNHTLACRGGHGAQHVSVQRPALGPCRFSACPEEHLGTSDLTGASTRVTCMSQTRPSVP